MELNMQVIDIDKVLQHNEICAIVKMAGMLVQKNSTLKLADFVRSLSIEDLTLITAFASSLPTHNPISMLNMMALSEILAFGEGLVHNNDDESRESLLMAIHAIILEGLKRSNLVEIDYSKLNFESTPTDLIASLTDAGIERGIVDPNVYP